ncbi:hypothetical protein, conserved [Plasmodium ovale curtisi]|uniref:Uncharacterized protein n=1 Tax=Plasmodium ovale curtisi TaxID=864141 RepID=A0A1A8WZT1_PLAOA|nr:hypothetical protein, conserved [Plasmodium ovale curtisi]
MDTTGIENLLFADYKDYNYEVLKKKIKIRIASIDFSIDLLFSNEDINRLIEKLYEICRENNLSIFILIGSYLNNYQLYKDMGMFFYNSDVNKDDLVNALLVNKDIKLSKKGSKNITWNSDSKNIDTFQINNQSYSRKRLEYINAGANLQIATSVKTCSLLCRLKYQNNTYMESERANGDVSSDNPRKKEEEITNEYIQNEILETYDIFSKVYESSDNLSFVDSEEDISSKNLEDSKRKNVLSLAVHNIINIYPNNERNREFKKYKQKKIEEKRKKEFEEEKKITEEKKKIYEEKRQKKLEIYKLEKKKKKLIEKEKYNKENIEYNYVTISNYFEYLMKNGMHSDLYFSFHDLYISPMRKWLSDNYVPIILELCSRKKIKILNLSYNKITFSALIYFSRFLSENKNVFCLNLESNDLTNDGNNFEEMNTFFDSIKNNKAIKMLNLANTNMNKNNGDALCHLLETNKAIIEMNFEDNYFTCDQNCRIIEYLIRNKNTWIKQAEVEKEENDKMEKEESYMHAYLMSVESSIIEIENKERRKNLNKMIYVNMWREEIKEKEKNEEAIHESLEKEHEKRIKSSRRKKKKKKKK